MHELVETWLPEEEFLIFPVWQSNVHFPWPNEMTICPDINGFQIPLKTSCTGHRWRKAKDFVVFCSGKICLVLFQGCCSFVSRHLCPVHKINAPTPIITILATHLLHEFIVNVKHRMDWSYRKRYICLSFNSGKQYPSDGICLTQVNMQKYVTYLYDFFERVRFSLTYTEIPWLDKLSLTGKIINFPGIVTDVTH